MGEEKKQLLLDWEPFYTETHAPSGMTIRVNKTVDRGRLLFSLIINRAMIDKDDKTVFKPFLPIFQAKTEPHLVAFQYDYAAIFADLYASAERVMHDALLAHVTTRNDQRYERDLTQANRGKPKARVTGKTAREKERSKPQAAQEQAPPKPLGVSVAEED